MADRKRVEPTVSQLERLTARIHAMARSGELFELSRGSRRRLIRKVHRLYVHLASTRPTTALRVALGGAAAAALVLGCNPDVAVPGPLAYAEPVANPFGIPTNLTGPVGVALYDIDEDGLLDLILSEPQPADPRYFRNTGSVRDPHFTDQSTSLGLQAQTYSSMTLQFTFGDIDGDADVDLGTGEAGEAYAGMEFYEWNGSTFDSISRPDDLPWALASDGAAQIPAFADLDGDGDSDVVLSEWYYGDESPTVRYFVNDGATPFAESGNTRGVAPFGGNDYSTHVFVDIDDDEDEDVLFVGNDGAFAVQINEGTASSPSFAPLDTAPFDLVSVAGPASLAVADLDGDGDLDVMVGDANGDVQFFENTSLPAQVPE